MSCNYRKNRTIRIILALWAGIVVLQTPLVSGQQPVDRKMAFIPFTDITVLKHRVWNIGRDIPRFFSDRMVSETVSVVPFDSVLTAAGADALELYDNKAEMARFGKRIGASYLVTGDIRAFKIAKKTAVMPELGGYKQYNAEVEIEVKVFDCDLADYSYTTMLIQDLGRRGLKFNPPGRLSRDEADYLALEEEPFASEAFMRTVIGEAMIRMQNDLGAKLEAFQDFGGDADRAVTGDTAAAAAPPSEARILQLDGGDAYINAGRDDRIRPGDTFDVYTRGEPIFDPATGAKLGYSEKKVGMVKVAKVKAAHFSRVKIMEGEGVMKVMDVVRLR